MQTVAVANKRRRLITPEQELKTTLNDVPTTPQFEYVMTVSQRWGFTTRNTATDKWWVVGRLLDGTTLSSNHRMPHYQRTETDGWRYQLQHVDTGVLSETLINDSFFPMRYTRTFDNNPFRVCIVGGDRGVGRTYEIFVDSFMLQQCVVNGTPIENETSLIAEFEVFGTTKHYQLHLGSYSVKLPAPSAGFCQLFNLNHETVNSVTPVLLPMESKPKARAKAKTPSSFLTSLDSGTLFVTTPSPTTTPLAIPNLYPEQLASLEWMTNHENRVRTRTLKITTNNFASLGVSGYSINTGCAMFVRNDCVNPRMQTPRLGILSNATGSGKTAIVVNMIKMGACLIKSTCGSQESANAIEWTDEEAGCGHRLMTTRRSRATLVVVPINLPQQWFDEFYKFYPTGKALKLTNKREHEALTYNDLMRVDCVITTMAFICGAGYKKQLSEQLGHNYHIISLNFSAAARGVVNKPGFLEMHNPILQLLWWRRVIYDEAHEIMTDPAHAARILNWTLSNLKGNITWALTGTPNMGSLLCREMYTAMALHTMEIGGTDRPPVSAFPIVDRLLRTCYHKNDVTQRRAQLQVHEYRVRLTPHEYRLINSYRLQNPIDMIQLATTYNVLDPAFIEELDAANGGIGTGSIKMLTLTQIEEHVQRARTRDIVRLQNEQMASQMQFDSTVTALAEAERQLVHNADNARMGLFATALRAKQVKQAEILGDHVQKLANAQTEYLFFQKQLHDGSLDNVVGGSDNPVTAMETLPLESNTILMDAIKIDQITATPTTPTTPATPATLDKAECPICMTSSTHVITRCGHWYCRECAYKMVTISAKCALCKRKLSLEDVLELNTESVHYAKLQVQIEVDTKKSNNTGAYGSKMVAIVDKIREIETCNEKIVMFVQWNRLMRSVKSVLKLAGVRVSCMDGNTHTRASSLVQFQSGASNVLLISIENGASGLNLIEANHVIFAHALVSHSAEEKKAMYDQSIGRVNRMGQIQDVIHIYWFISIETVEEDLFNAFI